MTLTGYLLASSTLTAQACTLPLTGANVVSRVITDLCVFDVDRENGGLTLVEKRDDMWAFFFFALFIKLHSPNP